MGTGTFEQCCSLSKRREEVYFYVKGPKDVWMVLSFDLNSRGHSGVTRGLVVFGHRSIGKRRYMEISSCLPLCPSKVWGDASMLPVTHPGSDDTSPIQSGAVSF